MKDDFYIVLGLFFSFEVIKMLEKINGIFRLKGIFDFLNPQFNTTRAKFDENDMEGKKNFRPMATVIIQLF